MDLTAAWTAENMVRELENRSIENIQTELQVGKNGKNKTACMV